MTDPEGPSSFFFSLSPLQQQQHLNNNNNDHDHIMAATGTMISVQNGNGCDFMYPFFPTTALFHYPPPQPMTSLLQNTQPTQPAQWKRSYRTPIPLPIVTTDSELAPPPKSPPHTTIITTTTMPKYSTQNNTPDWLTLENYHPTTSLPPPTAPPQQQQLLVTPAMSTPPPQQQQFYTVGRMIQQQPQRQLQNVSDRQQQQPQILQPTPQRRSPSPPSDSGSSSPPSPAPSPNKISKVTPGPKMVLKNPPVNPKRSRKFTLTPEMMSMRQAEAASTLGMATSTFSKRWRESLQNRKWPHRKNRKIDNKIAQLMAEKKKGKDVDNEMAKLVIEKEKNLLPASITYNDADVTKEVKSHCNGTT